MALGDGGQQNMQRKSNEDTYNSRLTLFSPEGNKYLKFKFWAGKIAVSINVGENTQQGFRYKDTMSAFLTPIKAKMMSEELKKFIEDKKANPGHIYSENYSSEKSRSKETLMLQLPKQGNQNRFLCYKRNNEEVTVIYMEGTLNSLDTLRELIK